MSQFLKTTQISIDGARTLPRRYYVEPGLFAEELEKIFAQRWLCVGREDQIAQQGQYFLQQVGVESIIVLRDRAGAGIYLTSRGAESLVEGSIDQLASRARTVMNEEGIVPDASSTEAAGTRRELKGKKGDLDITFELEEKSDKTTRVEVSARKNLAEWDKEYAQQLLQRLVEKS